MDDYKNSTKTQYFKGGPKNEAKGAAKVAKVMGEFKSGKLHSGSKHGPEVTSKKQATAIALSEARKAGAKVPVKRREGTPEGSGVEGDDALVARMTPRELAMGRAGIAAARARLSKAPARKGVPVDSRKAMIGSPEAADTYLARMPRGAVKPAESTGPFRVLRGRTGLKNGGLATMPKKGC